MALILSLLVLAIALGFAGFGGFATELGGIARVLFFACLAILLTLALTARRSARRDARSTPELKPGEDAPAN